VAAAQQEGRTKLSEIEVMRILEAYGIPVAPYRLARSAAEAVMAADEVGYPVAMKVVSPSVVHKSDVGGVRLRLADAAAVRAAFAEMMHDVPRRAGIAVDAIDGVVVQKMTSGGKETIIGASWNPGFGPLLMFGLGGIYVEAIGDVVFRLHPVSDQDAREMVRSVRGIRLLEGLRGEPPVDLDAAAEVVLRVSQLVGEHDAITELDINPWIALPEGGLAVDGRITIRTDAPPRPPADAV
jgi:acyl-CoA synthetase (NDP forming)